MTQDAGQPTPVFTLHDIASQLEENIAQFEASNNELVTDKKYLEWAVWKVALQLLHQDEAILLPKVTFRLLQAG